MRHTLDPKRLADLDRDGARSLGSAIRALREQGASAAEVDSLARRMAPQFATPAGAVAGAVAGGVSATWIALLLLAAALGFYALAQRGGDEPRRPAAVAPAPPHAISPALAPAAESPSVAAPESTPAPAVAARVSISGKPQRPHALPVAAPSPARAAPDAELTLLQHAQVALDREPAEALRLAEQHARAYPAGLFAQEREILAIEALLKLRRRPAALARAAQFVQRYPDSAHARRVRSLLERAPHASPPTIAPASDHSSTDTER